MDLRGLGTLVLSVVGAFNAWQAILAKREARAAKNQATSAHAMTSATNAIVVKVRTDMAELAENTNSKMDQTLEAVRAEGIAHAAVAGLEGERAGIATGIAQEVARQNKEST
jgi:hypothetical protein